uniref:LRAT domain-containing protein n=1 Tax=Magallana gigas TaxID=29159 RepID=A0A8W8L4Z0_MAGGI
MAAKQFDSHNRSVIRRARNEEVVHLAGDENDGLNGNISPSHAFTISGKSFNKAVVKRENVWQVVLDSRVEINNSKDQKCQPRRPHEIVEEALMKIGDIGYNVLWKSCEHFAAYCRYGVNWSEQADLTAVAATEALVALGTLCKELFNGDKKEKEKA